jgi:hypothetical protein
MPTLLFDCLDRRKLSLVLVSCFFFLLAPALQAQRVTLAIRTPGLASVGAGVVDVGAMASSEPLQLALRLSMSADRSAALDQLLSDQMNSSSASYHQWLTPQQFAAQFGATDDQIAATTSWLQSQGFTVGTVSPARTRITFSGTAAQVESAFAVMLRRYQLANALYFANSTQPSLPKELASLVSGVSGLDDMPPAAAATLATFSSAGPLALPADSGQSTDPMVSAAAIIDANAASILAITTNACSTDLVQSDYDAYHDLFRQANSQGMTILATSGCGVRSTGSFPASLGEVTALTLNPAQTPSPFVGIAPRPAWQNAPGLPADSSRDEADLTTSSVSNFAQTLTTILQKSGSRQGNINSILYELAPTPNLYIQPNANASTPAGTWEPATGLGVVNLALLAKDFPLGTAGSTTSIVSSNYSPTHGQSITLTATVAASAGSGIPTGTVTFSTQSSVLGTTPLIATSLNNAVATYTTNQLPGGGPAYTFSANYNGDATYTGSNATLAPLTIQPEASQISAVVVPGAMVGGNVTVNITVVAASGVGTPSGTVTVTPQGTGSTVTYNGTLTRAGANSAFASVSFAATQVGSTTLLVNCISADTSFSCFSPISVQAVVGKATSTTVLTIAPNPPLPGQAITLTATVPPAGTIPATGTVTFMDGTTVLGSATLAAGVATYSEIIPPGKHVFTAGYGGDSNFTSSTSLPLSASTLATPGITLTSNVPASGMLAGLNVVLTATVFNPGLTTADPSGTVALYDTYNGGIVLLGMPTLIPDGPNQSIAVFSTTGLLAGPHAIYAVYSGDANFNAITSATLGFSLSDYSVTMNPQTLTVSRGGGAQVAMLLNAISGFSGTVSFACTPPPNAEMTCSFSPTTLVGGGATTMTLTTTAAGTSAAVRSPIQREWNRFASATLALLFGFALPRRRRALPRLLLLLCAVCLGSIAGCGNGTTSEVGSPTGSSTPTGSGTPLGTQVFTITTAGSDGTNTIRHNYQYQITVQ